MCGSLFTIFTKSRNTVRALLGVPKRQNSFVCYGEKTYCCFPFCPSYSSKAPAVYCFYFGGIWYPKQSACTALWDLVKMVNS